MELWENRGNGVRDATLVRFGPFLLDVARRQLTSQDGVVHLTPKAFDLLHILTTEAPRVVGKQELHERLWPGVFVSEASLTGLVKELRRALRDDDPGRPVIRTVHRVGYACGLEVGSGARVERGPCHWLALAGRRIVLHVGENVIGRDPGSDVWLDAPGVSRRHARIVVDGEDARIEDLASKNGTTVGARRVDQAVALRHGDRITFGSVKGTYSRSNVGLSTETGSLDASVVRPRPKPTGPPTA